MRNCLVVWQHWGRHYFNVSKRCRYWSGGQCVMARQLCFPPSDHGKWTNSLNSLPQLSDETFGGLCTRWRQPAVCKLPQQRRRTCSAASTRLLPACAGLLELHQTVAVGCLNCLSTFHGEKAENSCCAIVHWPYGSLGCLHRALVPTTLANIKMTTLSVLSDHQTIFHKVYWAYLTGCHLFF